jgi:hypothetical protein
MTRADAPRRHVFYVQEFVLLQTNLSQIIKSIRKVRKEL